MSVKVHATVKAYGSSRVDEYPTGTTTAVREGHLHIYSSWDMHARDAIAVYAPDTWTVVKVEGSSQA